MLQQTRVDQVVPYYHRFLRSFPTIGALSKASLDEVMKVWEGMGYYRRAAYARDAAREIVKRHDGRLPADAAQLRSLPGFGPYTTAAVLSIAFNVPAAAVDGNVLRVISRLFMIRREIGSAKARHRIELLVLRMIPPTKAADFSQALMELGAMVCTPTRPGCGRCPLRRVCKAYAKLEDVSVLPRRKPPKPKPHYNIAIGLVQRNGRILIAKRPAGVILGNLWEFPGGKQEDGETLEETCRRELMEEMSIRVRILGLRKKIRHAYSHFSVTIHVFDCQHVGGTPKPKSSVKVRWARIVDLRRFAFPKANKIIVDELVSGRS